MFVKYNYSTNVFRQAGDISREKDLNGFTVTNIGDVIAFVNGKVLFPSATPLVDQGDSMSFGGNENETYIGRIVLAFDANTLGTNPQVEIIQKFYVTNY